MQNGTHVVLTRTSGIGIFVPLLYYFHSIPVLILCSYERYDGLERNTYFSHIGSVTPTCVFIVPIYTSKTGSGRRVPAATGHLKIVVGALYEASYSVLHSIVFQLLRVVVTTVFMES